MSVATNVVGCPRCGMEVQLRFFESAGFNACHVCGTQFFVVGFPPSLANVGQALSPATSARTDEDAACFHHETRKAAHSCARCGKFLCTLCASQVGNDVLCPACLVAGVQGSSGGGLEQERTLYDSIALALGIFPAFTVWFAGFGGVAAIYVALRYWKSPGSIVRRYRWRLYLALLFGLGEIGLTVALIVVLVNAALRTGSR